MQNFTANYTFRRPFLLVDNRTFANFPEFTCSHSNNIQSQSSFRSGQVSTPQFHNIKAHVVKPITGKGYDVVPIVAFDMRAGSRSDALSSNPIIPNSSDEHVPILHSSLIFLFAFDWESPNRFLQWIKRYILNPKMISPWYVGSILCYLFF